jgi:hypothetical protein
VPEKDFDFLREHSTGDGGLTLLGLALNAIVWIALFAGAVLFARWVWNAF